MLGQHIDQHKQSKEIYLLGMLVSVYSRYNSIEPLSSWLTSSVTIPIQERIDRPQSRASQAQVSYSPLQGGRFKPTIVTRSLS